MTPGLWADAFLVPLLFGGLAVFTIVRFRGIARRGREIRARAEAESVAWRQYKAWRDQFQPTVFACPHMALIGVQSASCGLCGPLQVAQP